jgi:transposase
MSENPEIFVGIDISKDTLDIGFQPSGQTVQIPHDEPGITEATRRLREAAPRLVVLEATGGLETRLAASLTAAGVPVAVVNPRQVRDYAKATGQLAKTDRIDAWMLADFARAIRPAVRPMKEMFTRELDDLVTRRRQLVEIRIPTPGPCLEAAAEKPEEPHRLVGQAHRGPRYRFEAALTRKPRLVRAR